MKKSKFFLGLTIALGLLFVLDCFSIIFCVKNGGSVDSSQKVEHILGFVYLFIHMLILVVVFYFSLKAYLQKSQLISIVMTNEDGTKNKKAMIRAIVFGSLAAIVGVYFALVTFGLNIPLSFFSLGLKTALMNVGISVCTVCVFLAAYKPTTI